MRWVACILALCLAPRAIAFDTDLCLRGDVAASSEVSMHCRGVRGLSGGGGGPPLPPAQFATACYAGNGTDDREIITGVLSANAGLLRICEKTAQSGNTNVCAYLIPGLGAGVSCAYTNADFDPGGGYSPCGADRIQAFGDGFFQIGQSTEVNSVGRPYCYEQWTMRPGYHGTAVYTGDGEATQLVPITPGSLPIAAIVWGVVGSSSLGNIPWMHTDDMPANTSYPAAQNATAGSTVQVRAFTAGFVEVGSGANVDGREYHLAWWGETDGTKTFTYTGNGNTLDSGKCGSALELQTVTTPCSPLRDVWITAPQTVAEIGGCSITRADYCARWRSTAVGFSVIGPGNLQSSDDMYAFTGAQPNQSGPGLLGALSGADFVAGGGPNIVASCNDNAGPYYGLATCAAAPVSGEVEPANWTFHGDIIAAWELDQATGAPAPNVATFLCGAACDLTNTNSVVGDTAFKAIGVASAGFTAASLQKLTCPLATCSALNVTFQDLSWGCYATSPVDAARLIMEKGNADYGFFRNDSTDEMGCLETLSGGSVKVAASGNNTWPADSVWRHWGCGLDATAETLQAYVNGKAAGSAATGVNSMKDSSGSSPSYKIGVNDALVYHTGNIDECFVAKRKFTASDWCRVASCGLNGTLCSCWSEDPTVYVNTGRFSGDCTLPVCNKAGPG